MNDRSATLQKLLDSIPGRRLHWTSRIQGTQCTARLYSANGKVFIVYEYGQTDGWDIYVPVSDSNSVAKTTQALHAHLGIEHQAGVS